MVLLIIDTATAFFTIRKEKQREYDNDVFHT